MFALIIDQEVRQIFNDDPKLDGMNIVDIGENKSISPGWRLNDKGEFLSPEFISFDKYESVTRIKKMTRDRIDALFIQSDGNNAAISALAYFNRLSAKKSLTDEEKNDLETFIALDDLQERIRIAGNVLADAGDYWQACDEANWPKSDKIEAIRRLIDAC